MNSKYWEEEIETMPRERLRELQLQRLKKTIGIAAHSPFYHKVFQEHGITPDSIRTLDDIRKIPFTTKADMRANYPFGLVAGNMREDGVRIHSSSGTTGRHRTFTARSGLLGQSGCPLSVYGRHPKNRRIPKQFGLWYVYRRTGISIWS